MPKLTISEKEILQAALLGLQHSLAEVDGKIAVLRDQLRGRVSTAAQPRGERNLSPEARARIAAAQKKRWAAYRKSHKKVG